MRGKKITKEEFIERAKSVHGDRYDYSLVEFINMGTKVKILCQKHNEFLQSPNHHTKIKQGCPICAKEENIEKRKVSYDDLVRRTSERHGDKYSIKKQDFDTLRSKIFVECKYHGEFQTEGRFLFKGNPCKKCIDENLGKRMYKTKTSKENFIQRCIETHGNKYDYSKSIYKGSNKKIEIICKVHNNSFYQRVGDHIRGRGCPECGIENNKTTLKSHDEFIKQCIDKYGDKFDYSKTKYTRAIDEVTVTCPKHGDFKKIAREFSHYNQYGCPSCADESVSSFELDIKGYIKNLGFEIKENTKKIIFPLELDILLKSKNLAIECNGLYWHSELQGKDRNYHLNKTKLCGEKNIRLIHIFENEYLHKNKIVKSRLKSILNLNKYKIFARKCEVKEIDAKVKNRFLEKYHIQGADRAPVKLGLFYKNRLVAVMTFCKNRKALGKNHVEGEWELSRYVTINGFSIVGGAGKLLKYFERNFSPKKITSYADLRWSLGNLYYKLGFQKNRQSKPNYWYIKGWERKLYHRFNFRKSVLHKKIDKFDPKKTGWENMKDNGWNRIWDCGNLVFEKNYL